MDKFGDELEAVISGQRLGVHVILDDPAGNSYLQNVYAPEADPELEIVHYDRDFEQNEELGLNDINVDNYAKLDWLVELMLIGLSEYFISKWNKFSVNLWITFRVQCGMGGGKMNVFGSWINSLMIVYTARIYWKCTPHQLARAMALGGSSSFVGGVEDVV